MADTPQDNDQPSPKPKRRYGWWLFFALIVLLASLALTFLVPAYRQLALLERIEAAGGVIYTEPVGPEWLRKIFGDKKMRGFDKVKKIFVNDPRVNDDTLEGIDSLVDLEYLNLGYHKLITVREDLIISRAANITDAGLIHLKGLNRLGVLNLGGTQITDTGLVFIKAQTSLEYLNLDGTQVSDVGLEQLKGLTNLRILVLDDTQVGDAGLVHLKGLTNLEFLYLRNTQVTDAGVVTLKGLTNLKEVRFTYTKVTDAGVKALKAALPDCESIWN